MKTHFSLRFDRWQEVEFVLEAQRDRGLSDNMVFYNALLDALWELGQYARAIKIMRAALARGTFPEAVKRSDMIWAIDVHRMSGGAALALLYSWLGEMRALRKVRQTKFGYSESAWPRHLRCFLCSSARA